MAITIQQQPTSPNMGNAHLLWVVTSNSSSEAQYQFVADVYVSGSSTRVQRVKQQPNPDRKGVFDLVAPHLAARLQGGSKKSAGNTMHRK